MPADAAAHGTDPLLRFSRGEIGRQRAMALLGGIPYGALLDQLAERHLPLPELPAAEVRHMADQVVRLLADAGH